MTTQKKYVDILLVGKTGNGKSATGNSILQKKNAFQSTNSMTSVTRNVQFDYSEFEGTIFKVVDGPGIGDTEFDSKTAVKVVVDAMSYAIAANPDGYHAILPVVRYGGCFTREDTKTFEILKSIFGERFIKDHAILIVTCGDNFHKDAKESHESFEQWYRKQYGVFGQLVSECEERVILIDNKTKDENSKAEQIRRLLAVIDGLSKRGVRYTNEHFNLAKKSRERLYNDSKRPALHEDFVRETSLITQELGRIDISHPIQELDHLKILVERVDALCQSVVNQDRGTNTLNSGVALVKNLRESLAEWTYTIEDVAQMKKREDEMVKNMEKDEEARRMAEEKANRRIRKEEKKRREEEKKRKEEECRRREDEERRHLELMKIRNEEERREAERRDAERKEAERKELLRLEAERREEERKREEQIREEERKRREEEEEERRQMEKEYMRLKIERETMAKQREEELLVKVEKLDQAYRDTKKEETQNSWASWGVAGAVAAPIWNAVSKWWSG